MKLEQYFEAYDNTHALAAKSPEWSSMRRTIHRSLARPVLELAGQVVFLLGCVALGFWGHPIGYLLALGTLCFIPQYVGELKTQIAGIKGLTNEDELQKLLIKEAQQRMAVALVATLWYGLIALLFLGTGALAAWRGKDFSPGLIAGLIVGALCAHALLIRHPRASREIAMLDRESEESTGSEEGRHGN